MIKKILIGFVLVLGLSVQSQTAKPVQSFDTKVKNYVQWFESLPDNKKREESRIFVNKLNMMSPYDKGMWLATIEKYSKKTEDKKNVVDSLSNDGVKKKLIKEFNTSNYIDDNEKLDTIIIVSSSTAKYRTDSINREVRKEISRLKDVILKADKIMDSIGGSVDFHYRPGNGKGDKEYMDAYHDKEDSNYTLPRLRDKIITYYGNGGDERWNSYLIDKYEVEIQFSVPHKLSNEELDSGITSGVKFDKKKRRYTAQFVRGVNYYKDKIRDDKLSRFNINEKSDFDN